MKPKAPKKKDTKPNCKTGEVRYGGYQDVLMNSKPLPFEILDAQLDLVKMITIWYKNRKD